MEQRLRGILSAVGGLDQPIDRIGADDDLFAAGLTSVATVSVLIATEEEFGVEIPDALLKRDTFRSISALGAVVDRLQISDAA